MLMTLWSLHKGQIEPFPLFTAGSVSRDNGRASAGIINLDDSALVNSSCQLTSTGSPLSALIFLLDVLIPPTPTGVQNIVSQEASPPLGSSKL